MKNPNKVIILANKIIFFAILLGFVAYAAITRTRINFVKFLPMVSTLLFLIDGVYMIVSRHALDESLPNARPRTRRAVGILFGIMLILLAGYMGWLYCIIPW